MIFAVMWPFSQRRASRNEQDVSREEFDELVRRVKAVERENDDLHAAYRRLRASRAAEAREPSPPPNGSDAADAMVSPKDALRRRAASLLHRPGVT
jgi:hypothetical protein